MAQTITSMYCDSLHGAATQTALSHWASETPGSAVLTLVAEADQADIPQLQALCNTLDLQLMGALFPELLDGETFKRKGALLLKLNEAPAYRIVEGLSIGTEKADQLLSSISEVAHSLEDNGSKGTLLTLFDAMVPTIESWLAALYRDLGRSVYYLGANAGSETFQPTPCLFDNHRIAQDAVLAIALPQLPGGVLEHGYRPPEHMITATSTNGNRIISIDWRPALEVYSEIAKREYGVEITRENFYQHGVHFPFGIVRASNEVLVRIPVAIDDDGALVCIGEVPENAILTLLHADTVEAQQTVNALVRDLGDTSSQSILTFYCAGRRMHDPLAAAEELQILAQRLPAPLVGALSLGEIGSSTRDGYPLFHNATLVCADWN